MPASNSARRAVERRRRQVRRRRQMALLVTVVVVVLAVAAWTIAGGSGGSKVTSAGHAHTVTSASASGATSTTTGASQATTATSSAAAASPGPQAVRPMVAYPRTVPPWTNPSPWAGQPAPVLLTRLISDNAGNAVNLAWFRQSRTAIALYPGYKNPTTYAANRGPTEIPLSARKYVVAAFNSGFYEKDAPAGFYTHGTLYHPMVYGEATVVEHTDGTVDIIRWTGGSRPGPDIVVARQNLGMLVSAGHVATTAGILSDWGLTWQGAYAVWRSALGIDKNGNLIYAAGPGQSVSSIATALIHAGAVRAMQLDINPYWPILVTFGAPGGHLPTLVTPNPNQIPGRFLATGEKDFFAVYLSNGGPVVEPW